MQYTIYQIITFLFTLITLLILVRALLSWFYPVGRDRWSKLLVDVTEPLLAPVRNLMMRVLPIPIDFSPIVVILLLQLLQNMLTRALLS